ncbi:alpha/beta hydrolase [Tsuneonella aeria]|uniref:alpha/beta hydrolase n=1 Tax=Tsuneonella aeria TaxID=1837929 RepID=UPI001927A176|nr:alpha/beta hydrolase [Tsuneonella aeria]
MRILAAALLLSTGVAYTVPGAAQSRYMVSATEFTEYADKAEAVVNGAAYGPFRVLDGRRAALVDATDGASPQAFAAMLRDNPGIAVIEMVECPGTDNDAANLSLGRMIRAAGLSTHVPANGSVRSGAVELFLAGRTRSIADGAEFAVHAWRDSDGREPEDFAADSPANRAYLDYYREMGLAHPQAFYAMTNAVANADARWLTANEMRAWISDAPGDAAPLAADESARAMAQLDLNPGFP